MAKYEADLKGNFGLIINEVDSKIKSGFSSSCEEQSDYVIGNTRIVIRAYERYSMVGGNRVSLTVTFAECEGKIHVTAIATGGSQAMLFKVNKFGEKSFLDSITDILNKYKY